MASFVVVVIVLLGSLGLVSGDKSVSAAGVTVQVMGQSGKMAMTLGNQTIDVKVDALRELAANGDTLGGGGSTKHSFNSFATQDFVFSEPMNGTYRGLQVAVVTFHATLVGTSNLLVEIMVFKEAGSFLVGTDKLNVTYGAVKFNVQMSNWTWCGGDVSCTASDGIGDSVELDISVSPRSGVVPNKTQGQGKKFDLGGGAELVMLDTYSTDNGSTWVTMPAGYPKSSGSTFTLKFPRWNGTAIYDPLVSGSSTSSSSTSGGVGSTTISPGLTVSDAGGVVQYGRGLTILAAIATLL